MRRTNYIPWRQTDSMMWHPETKEDVKRSLSVINYLARFIPHQSANSKASRSLLKEDTAWKWSTQHEKEWNEI